MMQGKDFSKQMGGQQKAVVGKTDYSTRELLQGTTPTPFSLLAYYLLHGKEEEAKAQLAEDIEWILMPNNQSYQGKEEAYRLISAGWMGADKRTPDVINNVAGKDWGIFEYWNIGTVDEGIIQFAKVSKWPFPKDIRSTIGRDYKLPVCFVYHFNGQGKIDLLREYLDVGSVIAQISGDN